MKTSTFSLLAALPAALAQCRNDGCSRSVKSLLNGGEALADYASGLCSSAMATTTTVQASKPTPYLPNLGSVLGSILHKDKRGLIEDLVPSWASGCNDQAAFASACQCASVVPGTSTVIISSSASAVGSASASSSSPLAPISTAPSSIPAASSSTPVAPIMTGTGIGGGLPPYHAPSPPVPTGTGTGGISSSHPSSSSAPYPQGNSTTYPSGFSTGVPLSSLPGSALPSGIQYVPQSSIAAGPTGPTTLVVPTTSSSLPPYTSTNATIPTGFSTGVPLSSLPSSALPSGIQYVPQSSIEAGPTGPTTLVVPTTSSSLPPYTSTNATIPSGFSTGMPLSSLPGSTLPGTIQFFPTANITRSPTGPTTLSPVYVPTTTGSAVLPGASLKAKRDEALLERGDKKHTPCQPKQVGIFFHLLTGVTNPCE